jgi:hypothetical protein
MQAPPCAFQRLVFGVVHDCVNLVGQDFIDLSDSLVDRCHDTLVGRDPHPLVEYLRRELSQQFLGVGALGWLTRHIPFLHNPIQEASLGGYGRCARFGQLFG